MTEILVYPVVCGEIICAAAPVVCGDMEVVLSWWCVLIGEMVASEGVWWEVFKRPSSLGPLMLKPDWLCAYEGRK